MVVGQTSLQDRRNLAVLVVEDDEKLGPLVERGLARAGFAPWLLGTGRDALETTLAQRFAAIVLDIGLPDTSGLDVCRTLRDRGDITPILVLTAASSVPDRVLGLNAPGQPAAGTRAGLFRKYSSRGIRSRFSLVSPTTSGGRPSRTTTG